MTFQRLRSAQDRLADAGGKPLGSLIWWSLNGNRIGHDQLEHLAAQHHLHARYLPNPIKPTQAFRRAWRHTASKLANGQMLRPIADTADEVVLGLVQERPDEATRDLDHDVLARITFDKTPATIRADRETIVAESVRQMYRHHLAHTTSDIRSILTSFLSESAVSLREHGGVYFVPADRQRTLDAVCAVVEAAGNNRTFQLPIVDTPEGKATLRSVTQKTLDDEVRQLQEQLERFDDDKVRDSTLERRLEAFEDLRSRAVMFGRVLSFKADSLNDRIGAIQTSLRQRLGIEPIITQPQPDDPSPRSRASLPVPCATDVGF